MVINKTYGSLTASIAQRDTTKDVITKATRADILLLGNKAGSQTNHSSRGFIKRGSSEGGVEVDYTSSR